VGFGHGDWLLRSPDAIFRDTLRQLETGFSVSMIATGEAHGFDIGHPLDEVVNFMKEKDFSQVVATSNGTAIGVFDISRTGNNEDRARLGDRMIPMSGRMLVSANSDLRSLIKALANDEASRFRLVIGNDAVVGIVTRSDLQKLPVQLLAYSYVAHLESIIASAIEHKCEEREWLEVLEQGDTDGLSQDVIDAIGHRKLGVNGVRSLKRDQERHRKRDTTPYLMEMTYFPQKWFLAWKIFGLDARFASEMMGIQKYLRNSIAHGRGFVEDDFQLEHFDRRLKLSEKWIDYFTGFLHERPNPAPPLITAPGIA
jgi:CBS domain-containing protein